MLSLRNEPKANSGCGSTDIARIYVRAYTVEATHKNYNERAYEIQRNLETQWVSEEVTQGENIASGCKVRKREEV